MPLAANGATCGLESPKARTADCQPLLCEGCSICRWWPLLLHVGRQGPLWAEPACRRVGLASSLGWHGRQIPSACPQAHKRPLTCSHADKHDTGCELA